MNTKADFDLYGIFGYPLQHTLSPVMQESALKTAGRQAFYLPFELELKYFKAAMKGLKHSLLKGFNITVPYKETILPYLDKLSVEAKEIGAVNTVYKKGKKIYGTNTDVYGFTQALKKDAKFNPRGKRVLILGAGGSSKAVLYALAQEKVLSITVVNRNQSKALHLIRRFKGLFHSVRFENIQKHTPQFAQAVRNADLIVNATSLGLKAGDKTPLKFGDIPRVRGSNKKLFFDLIYRPERTKFLKMAKQRGHQIQNGLGMLLYQGAKSFEIWTGKKAPLKVMRQSLISNL